MSKHTPGPWTPVFQHGAARGFVMAGAEGWQHINPPASITVAAVASEADAALIDAGGNCWKHSRNALNASLR